MPPIGPPVDTATGNVANGSCDKLLGLLRLCLPILNPRYTAFRWVASNQRWSFLMDTTGLTPGVHRFAVPLADGTNAYFSLSVRPLG